MDVAFETLPLELIARVADFLDLMDKKNTRSVSLKLCHAVTPSLFHTLAFWPRKDEGNQGLEDEESNDESNGESDDEADETSDRNRVRACKEIFNNAGLRKHVHRLRIHTEPPGFSGWDYCNESYEPNFLKHWSTISRLDFPFLRSVSLNFDEVCWLDSNDDGSEYAEDFEFRTKVMHHLLQYLDENRNHSVRELSLSNLQNYDDEGFIQSDIFKRVLQRLQSLRLSIITEYCDASPEASFHYPEMHSFGATLRSAWLQPACSGLTRLALYWDTRWGYVPKVDFRDMHLPQLQHLELGKWTISHDWQIDWLISHGEKLQKLWMDDCHILVKASSYIEMDHEGYPKYSATSRHSPHAARRGMDCYEYNRKWAKIFDRFSTGLPNLRDFRFGTSNWGTDPLEEVIKQCLDCFGQADGYYVGFYGGRGPSPWCDPPEYDSWVQDLEQDDEEENEDGDDIELEDEEEAAEQAAKEDEQALVRLLRKIGQPIPSFEDDESSEP